MATRDTPSRGRRLRWVAIVGLLFALLDVLLVGVIGTKIGPTATLLWLLTAAAVGSVMMRWQGRRAWSAVRAALQSQRSPAQETIGALLVYLGGFLLIFPGPISDVVGLLLIIPVVRGVVARGTTRLLLGVVSVAGASAVPPGSTIHVTAERAAPAEDGRRGSIDGEVLRRPEDEEV